MLNPPLGPPSLRPISVASFLMNEYHIKSALDARACGWGGGKALARSGEAFSHQDMNPSISPWEGFRHFLSQTPFEVHQILVRKELGKKEEKRRYDIWHNCLEAVYAEKT